MPNTVIAIKKSATPASVPSSLEFGELALNYNDGKLFYKNTAGQIAEFSSGSGSNFGTVNASGTLIVSDTSGDILTLLAGNNITITGDAVNDRITIGLTNDVTLPGVLYMQAIGGDEGGQIELANAITNSTLSGNVVIDIYQNRLRFYEKGSPNKGAFLDLSLAGSGVSTNLLSSGSGGATSDTVARTTANAAFDQANTSSTIGSAAFGQANTARTTANAAFGQANTAQGTASSASFTASDALTVGRTSFNVANAAFNRANTAGGLTIGDQTTSSLTFYPILTTNTSGSVAFSNTSSTKLSFVPSTGTLSATVFNSLSDVNYKTNINTISNALNKVSSLRGVEFTWKDNEKRSIGLIAQEVYEIIPEVVNIDENDVRTLNYDSLIGVLIEAIKELKQRLETVEEKNNV